jgi:low affinity Fe/Cu permease
MAKAETETEEYQPKKAKFVSDPRSRIAAMAIALVGSIIWMASDK